MLYLSSRSVDRPWPGLGPYAASKAALNTLVEAERADHPDVAFCRVVVGDTVTEFADRWDPALFADAFVEWEAAGLLPSEAPI